MKRGEHRPLKRRVVFEYRREQYRGTYDSETGYLQGAHDLPDGGRVVVSARCNHDGKGEALRITPARSVWERLVARLRRSA